MNQRHKSALSLGLVIGLLMLFQNCAKFESSLEELEKPFGLPVQPDLEKNFACTDKLSTGLWESDWVNPYEELEIKDTCRVNSNYCESSFKYKFTPDDDSLIELLVLSTNNNEGCLSEGYHVCTHTLSEEGDQLNIKCGDSAEITYHLRGDFTLKQKQVLASMQPNEIADCTSNPDYNACLFYKSPVDKQGAAFSPDIDGTSDLTALQTDALILSGFDASGSLSDGFAIVQAIDGASNLVSLDPAAGFKFSYADDEEHKLSQTIAYSVWTKIRTYMNELTRSFYADDFQEDTGQLLQILASDDAATVSEFDGANNRITLASNLGKDDALDADLIAHLIGQANTFYATNGAIADTAAGPEAVCASTTGTCCTTANGCASAILSGAGDYQVLIVFPNSTGYRTTAANDPAGLSLCGANRSPAQTPNLTGQQAFDACVGTNESGHATSMGQVYASIWWEVRKQAEALYPGTGAVGIDILFTAHLPALTGSDDFLTALEKIIATDNAIYEMKFANLFIAEFDRRGYTLP